jgi:C-terminal processing protease CtpA/Prc
VGATPVGSPTAGVNGDLTNVYLSGGVCVRFTGQKARLPNGGPLLRVGLRPDIEVRATAQGLRAGRYEVLERALRLLREGR